MKKPKPTITEDEWLAALAETAPRGMNRLPVGPGWIPRAELQVRFGLGRSQFNARLHSLVAAGRAERFIGVENARVAAWYRLLPVKGSPAPARRRA